MHKGAKETPGSNTEKHKGKRETTTTTYYYYYYYYYYNYYIVPSCEFFSDKL